MAGLARRASGSGAPRRGAAVLDTMPILDNSYQFLQICNPPTPRVNSAGSPGAALLLLKRAKMPPRWLKKSTFCKHFFDIVLASLLGGSMTVLEPNMAPTWVDFGAMLEPFWTILGVVLASQFKTVLRSDFDRFFIDFPPLGGTKNIEKHKVF